MTSAIEWLWPPWVDKGVTLNWILGCTHAGGPGCDHCWAERDTWTRQNNPNAKVAKANEGLTTLRPNGRPRWTNRVNMLPERFVVPFKTRQRWGIFAPSKSDPWHESLMDNDDGRYHVAAAWGMMAALPQHTWFVLSKRPHLGVEHHHWIRMRAAEANLSIARLCMVVLADVLTKLGEAKLAARVAESPTPEWPLPNVWVLTSVEDQQRYDERVSDLLRVEAAAHGLSVEPMVGPVTIAAEHAPLLDWVICGGEAGPGARPMHPDWARSLRDQCVAAGVSYFFKQWGAWEVSDAEAWTHAIDDRGTLYTRDKACESLSSDDEAIVEILDAGGAFVRKVGKGKSGRELDGRTWNQYPSPPEDA